MSAVSATPIRIIEYPHPTLRHRSKPLKRVDAELRRIIDQMFERMYEAGGIGLAANQVDLPYRFFIVNVDPERAKENEQVYINPVITERSGSGDYEEGCLSIPEVQAMVRRPTEICVEAYDLNGELISTDLYELPARVFQHELDHLDGVLFVDRLSETSRLALKDQLEEFEVAFHGRRERGEIPDDEAIARRLAELERLRT